MGEHTGHPVQQSGCVRQLLHGVRPILSKERVEKPALANCGLTLLREKINTPNGILVNCSFPNASRSELPIPPIPRAM